MLAMLANFDRVFLIALGGVAVWTAVMLVRLSHDARMRGATRAAVLPFRLVVDTTR